MNPIGFVSVPRTDTFRPAGAFFSATVETKLGPGTWRVVLDGRQVTVSTDLDLAVGQQLRLRLASQSAGRWIFQILSQTASALPASPLTADPGLIAAFVSRGLPAAAERLAAWTRWLTKGPSDKEAWAASLDARSAGPASPFAAGLDPWLAWQSALEAGHNPPMPQGEDYWDLWNARKPAGDPWLVMPLTWEYDGQRDSGLLQARWNPAAQAIDRWNLTAAPAGVPFRLEAASRSGQLDLVWRFFNEGDKKRWQPLAQLWQERLTQGGLTVSLSVDGPSLPPPPLGGVDVRA